MLCRVVVFALSLFYCLSTSADTETAIASPPPFSTFPSPPPAESQTATIFDAQKLFSSPDTYNVDPQIFAKKDGITPLFYEGEPYRGKSTRVFAWLGIPDGPGPFPGIVLVHGGGGGTAYRDWVKLWMARGYAAIAMDTSGATPLTEDGMRVRAKRHTNAGPTDKGNGFALSDQPPADQWVYHAVAAVIRAHSLLRTTPRVDPDRIGLTGISWGGVMTEIVASIDTRFKCAVPVYGSGFLGEDSFWLEKHFQDLPAARVEQWLRLWDPSQYVARIHMPVLFCDGTNDKFFRLGCLQKTIGLVPGPVTRSLRIRMIHGNPPHGDPPEVSVFIDSILKDGHPLPVVGEQGQADGSAWIKFNSADDLAGARLVYTTDNGPWLTRDWHQTSAKLETARASSLIPKGTTAYYFNLQAAREANVSSPLVIQAAP